MRIMIVGGGGREHALAWKISQSEQVEEIICVPGNPGIAETARCIEIAGGDSPEELASLARENGIDLTLVGPEAPLVNGIVDVFLERGLQILGPEKEAAMLEGSKIWAKDLMQDCGIPTASFSEFSRYAEAVSYLKDCFYPPVIKADGLAAGKGVIVPSSRQEAEEGLKRIMLDREFGDAGDKIVMEEKLEGEEASLLALTDGNEVIMLPPAQDHKPVGEGDTGPNTGGMGSYSPAPILSENMVEQAKEIIFYPLLAELKRRGLKYRGVIYAGLIIKDGSFSVLEFNVRFGDPETQAIIPRLDSDLVPLLRDAAEGKLKDSTLEWKKDASVCVVLSSRGYPGAYEKGKEITGLNTLKSWPNLAVFHAGTKRDNGKILTAGGRVLGITAWNPDLRKAINHVYRAAEQVYFEGCHYRRDIAYRAL